VNVQRVAPQLEILLGKSCENVKQTEAEHILMQMSHDSSSLLPT